MKTKQQRPVAQTTKPLCSSGKASSGHCNHTSFTVVKSRWMIVDDNEDMLWLMPQMLAAITDAEICCFRNGAEALRAFERSPEAFQLVVTDFDMPGMNGME